MSVSVVYITIFSFSRLFSTDSPKQLYIKFAYFTFTHNRYNGYTQTTVFNEKERVFALIPSSFGDAL